MTYSKCPACGYHAFNGDECNDCGYNPKSRASWRGAVFALVLVVALTGCAGLSEFLGSIVPGGGFLPVNMSAMAVIDEAVVCEQPVRTRTEAYPGVDGELAVAWEPAPEEVAEWCSTRVCVEPGGDPPTKGGWTQLETCSQGQCWDIHAPPHISGASRKLLRDQLCEARIGQRLYLDGPLSEGATIVPADINFKGLLRRR